MKVLGDGRNIHVKNFMYTVLARIFSEKEIRNKVLFIFGMLVVYRLAAVIPLPGVDVSRLQRFFDENQFLGLLDVFSGGGLSNVSIVLLGVAPYITASIIMQLLTTVIPRLEQIYKEEGEAGRQKFNSITRWITIPLAVLQTFSMISLFRSQGVLTNITAFDTAAMVIIATAGTILLMWLGELITEKGLGNGVSIMIFAGIMAGIPGITIRFFDTLGQSPDDFFNTIVFAIVALLMVVGIVFVNEAQRTIPISYAKRVRGGITSGGTSTHLPLRVNQAGVIPIIFSVSLVVLPSIISGYLMQTAQNPMVAQIATKVYFVFQNQWFYGIFYFSLVVLFTYFYTAVIFDPTKIAENLQKQGGYVPGIRPGTPTVEYLSKVLSHVTLIGAVFLGTVAVLPVAVRGLTGVQSLTIGGISILIVVSVVLEMVKHIQSQLAMRSYEGF